MVYKPTSTYLLQGPHPVLRKLPIPLVLLHRRAPEQVGAYYAIALFMTKTEGWPEPAQRLGALARAVGDAGGQAWPARGQPWTT